MLFRELALALAEIERQSARLAMTASLADLWRRLSVAEAPLAANLIQGQLQPAYESLEFYLSEKMVARALARLTLSAGGLAAGGVAVDLFGQADESGQLAQIKKVHARYGDWGETASQIRAQITAPLTTQLTISNVYDQLRALALEAGTGSQARKLDLLVALLQDVDPASAKIITRIVIGKLRLGFSLMTLLDSLSWAGTSSKSESAALEELYQKKADLGLLAASYLSLLSQPSPQRLQRLRADYKLQVGIPVLPALCQRLNSASEIIAKMGEVLAEPKYDGMRIQIHLRREPDDSRKIFAFTRSLENVSAMFPELTELAATLPVTSLILDSEAVGFKQGKILPFQEMMTRRRVHDIAAKSNELPVKFMVFDLLYLDGQELLELPLSTRKEKLTALLSTSPQAEVSPFITTSDDRTLHAYHQQQLQAGLEGVVVKMIDSHYQSGRKGWQWVKIKEAEGTRGKLKDTLDLLVLGVYRGKGKRHGFGVGAFLVALSDGAGNFLTLSKIGTGLTDDQFRELKQKADRFQVPTPPAHYQVSKPLTPDCWLAPVLVAEIAADEITISTNHTSGYGLRFPRLIRWREDKTADQVTTLAELGQLV